MWLHTRLFLLVAVLFGILYGVITALEELLALIELFETVLETIKFGIN